MKYVFLIIVLLIIFVIWRKIRSKSSTNQSDYASGVEETEIVYNEIIKAENLESIVEENNTFYEFEISSLTKNKDTLETLITIKNNSDKTARIDLKQAIYTSFTSKDKLKADVIFYGELAMGTNDILLKNTILPELEVIRNVYFFHINLTEFHQNDSISIDLLINDEPFYFTKYLHQSNIQTIKIIE